MRIQSGTRFSYVARLALVGLALSPLAVMAQQPDPGSAPSAQDGPPPHRGEHGNPAERQAHMLEMMTKRLNLTPDQVSQIKSIQADNETQMQALHADTSVQGPDKRAKMMDLRKAENEKIRAVLNDDQRAKFDEMAARRHDRMREHGGGDQAPPPPPAQ